MRRDDRDFDLVVCGATSFVGQILCRHLVARHGPDGRLRWAIAGRNATKLDQVAADADAHVEQIVADAADRAALDAMVARTRVVVSTVGPYARYGSTLVAAVAEAGIDYCDLTGEAQWMRRMIDQHSGTAERTGARIVHACGFDSIPSDLGVWFTQQQAVERLGEPCDRISMRVLALRGAASGGTIASMVNVVEEAATDPSVRRLLADPYCLAPPDLRHGVTQPDTVRPTRDAASGQWIGPFVMASVNTRVVHRTHALLGRPWGPAFRYDEASAMGHGPLGLAKAAALTGGLGVGVAALAVGPVRRTLAARVLPKPGSGPSPAAQARGSFELGFWGTTPSGARIETRVRGERDPGYGATARMLGEAAVALAELPADACAGGFWTPATALGERLLERLEAHAGMSFEVVS